MPGVVVATGTLSGPATPVRASSGQFFVAGLAERGAADTPILLRGLADYDRYLGGRVTYGTLYDTLRVFFAEGGSQAYVARVVGPAATTGTLTLNDRAVAPAPTLRVDAANPGPWSANVTIEVQDGSVPDTFRIVVRLNGTPVENIDNLAGPDAAVTAFRNSPYVRLTNLGSVTAAPDNRPAVLAATALSAGNDDRAAVTAAMMVAALDRFTVGYGDGAVAIPGQSATAVGAGIEAHCRTARRVGLLAGPKGATPETLAGLASATYGSEYVGLFAPHVTIPDDLGGVRTISPEGYVAAVRNRAHEREGAWRAPAGQIAAAQFLVGVDQTFTAAEADYLDSARVNAVRVIGGGIRLYGWRSMSLDTANYTYLSARDLLNRLVNDAEARLEDYVYATIDARGQLLSAVNAELVGIVEPIRVAGGLYEYLDIEGNQIDPGYRIDTGPNVNTPSSLANNEVRARLAVRVSPTGALVSLTIVKVAVTAALS